MIASIIASLALLTPPACRPAMCSCVPPDPVSTARFGSETIFEGRVLQLRDTTIWRAEVPRLRHYKVRWLVVTFEVGPVWNGTPSDTVDVLTGMGGGDCGYAFTKGDGYLVFADFASAAPSGPNRLLVTSICTHTTESVNAAAIRDSLGSPAARDSAAVIR